MVLFASAREGCCVCLAFTQTPAGKGPFARNRADGATGPRQLRNQFVALVRAGAVKTLPGFKERAVAPSSEEFRVRLAALLHAATDAGQSFVDVRAGDLHSAVGGYPPRVGSSHRMPMCCQTMRSAMRRGDAIVAGPAKGNGASLVIRYLIPRQAATVSEKTTPPTMSGSRIPGRRIVLVSCVKKKSSLPRPARDLYVSPFFKKMRHFAEQVGDSWFVLSAEYGLLEPDAVVTPYERTLKRMSADEKAAWVARVTAQIERAIPADATVVMLAGVAYRSLVEDVLRGRGNVVEVPLRGMGIGEQLHWLGEWK